ncbi:MAG: hypothetical protein WCD76_06820, partial [Pyrinomonadaceae bacterium]
MNKLMRTIIFVLLLTPAILISSACSGSESAPRETTVQPPNPDARPANSPPADNPDALSANLAPSNT